jgi:phosphoglycolate phosphatase
MLTVDSNVLFDLDGTLTDPREGIVGCLKYAILSLGQNCPPDLELVRFIGPPLQESFAVLLHSTDPKQINAAVELYRQRFCSKGMLENSVYPGIHSALTTLRERGALLFVATSKPRVFAEQIVKYFRLQKYFCAVYGSELDGARSNKADLIAHVLEDASLSPHSTVMVGDRAHDILGAKAQRVFPVGVLWVTDPMMSLSRQAQQRSANNRRHSTRFCYPIQLESETPKKPQT